MRTLSDLNPDRPFGLLRATVVLLGICLSVGSVSSDASRVFAEENPIRTPGQLSGWIDSQLGTQDGGNDLLCTDAEFIRRVSLDLNGMPPTADEARAFIADPTPNKRTQLIEKLLSSPLFERHLAASLDVMLMERRANTYVAQDEWTAWLLNSVRSNKPWNQLVREMILTDGDDLANRAPARFLLDRNAEPNVVARDVGRMFLGMDLQCAQCHDSPLVSDFLQADYQGILAFTSPTYTIVKKHGDKDVTVLAERSGTDLGFESVFARGTPHRTGPKLPGTEWLEEPILLPGEDYEIAPADGVKSVPKFSRRKLLADQMTGGANRAFNRNAANRLWSMVFGRGIVHPLDMVHPENPSPTGQFLEQMGEHFAAGGFDMKWYLQELVQTRAYQRAFDLEQPAVQLVAGQLNPADLTTQITVAETEEKAAYEQFSAVSSAFDAAEAALVPVALELETARTQYQDTWKKLTEAQKALADANAAHQAKVNTAAQTEAAATHAESAASLLNADAELTALARQLRDKTVAVQAELPALQKAVEEKTAAVKPVEETLAAQRTAFDAVVAKFTPLKSAFVASEKARVVGRERLQAAARSTAALKKQKLALEAVAAVASLQQEITAAESVLASLESESGRLTQELEKLSQQLTTADVSRKAAEQKLAEVNSQMQAAELSVRESETQLTLVREALNSLDKAGAALTGDAELQQTRDSVAAAVVRLESRYTQCCMTRDTMNEMQKLASAGMAEAQGVFASAELAVQQCRQTAELTASSRAEQLQKLAELVPRLNSSRSEVSGTLSDRFQLATLRALTPEQLCWTVFRVTTVYDRYVAGERAELDKTAPLTDAQKADPAQVAAREREIEQRTYDKLKQYIPTYVQFYGGGAGQPQGDFYASADQALFTANGGQINSWVVPTGDNASERMVKATDLTKAAEELYLGVLSRLPDAEETQEVVSILQSSTDRSRAAQELMWGLMNSAEFRFNH